MTPESELTTELAPDEAAAGAVRTIVLPWSGRTVTIRVPAGTGDGTLLRLAGLGPVGPDGAPQDAHVRVRVTGSPAASGAPSPVAPYPGSPAAFGAPPPVAPYPGSPAAFGAPPPVPPYPGNPAAFGAPGPAAPYPGRAPAAPGGPVRRKALLIGAAGTVLAMLLCCGLPLTLFLRDRDGDDPQPAAQSTESAVDSSSAPPPPSAPPLTPDGYQAALTTADQALAAGFRTLAAGKNPKAVAAAAARLATTATDQSRTLSGLTPPTTVGAAHDDLVGALADLGTALDGTESDARSGGVCLGPAAAARVSRETAAERVRTAARALTTADPARAYRIGSFVPARTGDGNRRLGNGSYLRRNRGGAGELTIQNGGADAVISVVRGTTAVTRVYVRGKSSFTVTGVRDGTYLIYMTSGVDWDGRLRAFARNCDFQRFDDSFRFTTTSRSATVWTISITPVAGGNASSSDVDPDGFPGG